MACFAERAAIAVNDECGDKNGYVSNEMLIAMKVA